jgi:hypothetical protein
VPDPSPVVEVSGRFADAARARGVAEALNRWFRWIVEGSEGAPPPAFDALGVATADWAWQLGEDVDWRIGPHARAVSDEVRIAIETHDTHARLSGLLRALGARSVRFARDT